MQSILKNESTRDQPEEDSSDSLGPDGLIEPRVDTCLPEGNISYSLGIEGFVEPRYRVYNGLPEGDSSDSLGPDGLVETGIDSDVLSSHLLHGELLDLLEKI